MGTVTMCRRAGRLRMGMDMTKDACAAGEAKAVLVAEDVSAKTLKEVKFVCAKYGVKLYAMGIPMDEIGFELGKRVGILAVCDDGFAKKTGRILETIENDTEIM